MIEALSTYQPGAAEQDHLNAIRHLIERDGDKSFYRDHFNPGHITGSALLLSADRTRVLMNHHKFLDIWICFGGHADGDQDILNVAVRETVEESGITAIEPVSTRIFDVDVHRIPANPNKNEPPHKHFDIRYLLRVTDPARERFELCEESTALRWCDYQQAKHLAADDASMHRLLDKWSRRG